MVAFTNKYRRLPDNLFLAHSLVSSFVQRCDLSPNFDPGKGCIGSPSLRQVHAP